MTDMHVQDQVTTNSNGANQSGVASTTQTVADPVTGAQALQTTTRMWSGRAPGIEIVWLIAGVVVVFLALDFVFRATGANNVGFAAFVFSIGTFFAAPFAGIFNTSYPSAGSVVVWADILAMVIYALLAAVISKVIGMFAGRSRA